MGKTQIEKPELTFEIEQSIKEKFKENKRLTADERKIVNYYGEYRFQTPEGRRKIKKDLGLAFTKWCLFIPDEMSLGWGLVMFGCVAIGLVAILVGV